MKKIITIFVLICGMAVVGCSKPQEVSIPLHIQLTDTLNQLLTQYKMSCYEVNLSIVDGQLFASKRNEFRGQPSLEKAVSTQYETSNDIVMKYVNLIKEVATRCGHEIDSNLEKKNIQIRRKRVVSNYTSGTRKHQIW